MIRVQVRPNEPLEAALRRFKRQCNYAGIFRLAKKYAYHEKRSDKNRREERERVRNIMIAERKREGSRGGRGNRRRRVRSSSVKPRRSGEQEFDPLTADTTPQKPAVAATPKPENAAAAVSQALSTAATATTESTEGAKE
jgi:small subunit ribosomal protein S21